MSQRQLNRTGSQNIRRDDDHPLVKITTAEVAAGKIRRAASPLPRKSNRLHQINFDFVESLSKNEAVLYLVAVLLPMFCHITLVQTQGPEKRAYLDGILLFAVACYVTATVVPGTVQREFVKNFKICIRTCCHLASATVCVCAAFSFAGNLSIIIGIFYVSYQIYCWISFYYMDRENKILDIASAAKNFLCSYRKDADTGIPVDIFIEEFLDYEGVREVAQRKKVKSMWPLVENFLLDDKRWKKTASRRQLASEGIEYKYNYRGTNRLINSYR